MLCQKVAKSVLGLQGYRSPLLRAQIPVFGFQLSKLGLVKEMSIDTKIPENIYGDWKEYTIKAATPADFDIVAKQIQTSFLKFEKMNLLIAMDEEEEREHKKDHDELVKIALGHYLSCMTLRQDNSEIVGCNLILDNRQPLYASHGFEPSSKTLRTFLGLLGDLEMLGADNFKRNFERERYGEILMTSVRRDQAGHGIAREMIQRSMAHLKAKGFQSIKGSFTGPISQAVVAKLGFKELSRIAYRDYTDKMTGAKVFPLANDDTFAAVMALAL